MYDCYDIQNVCDEQDICQIAMHLFKISGHTVLEEAELYNRNIKEMIYLDLKNSKVILPGERRTLDKVKNISKLFSLKGDNFSQDSDKILYFAISLNTLHSDRSQAAYEIHKIFCEIISPIAFSVIIFEANNECVLSFAESRTNKDRVIVLSDWFSLNDIDKYKLIEKLDVGTYSSSCIKDFFYDFEYNFARSYYVHPVSEEYARYEMFPNQSFGEMLYDRLDRITRNEIVENYYLLPLIEYKDDYVDIGDQECFKTVEFDIEDWDLFEWKLETEEQESEMDEENRHLQDDKTKEVDNQLEGIDEETLNDPVKLIEWLEKHDG